MAERIILSEADFKKNDRDTKAIERTSFDVGSLDSTKGKPSNFEASAALGEDIEI